MTNLSKLSLIVLMVFISCHHNRLNINEQGLRKEIILQENQKAEADSIANVKLMSENANRHQSGLRLKEDRSIDPNHPPVTIDIAGNLNNIKEIKLSDIASEISYIRIQPNPDSTFSRVMKFRYYLYDDHIIATNPCGILLYSRDGKFLNTIIKNRTTGISVNEKWETISGANTFIGSGTSVWTNGNSFFYNYRNSINGQQYIMEYDLSKNHVTSSRQYEPENPDQILSMGEIAVDLNPTRRKPEWKYNVSPDLMSWIMPREYIYQSIGTFYIDKYTYGKELERTDKIAVFNNSGDTLSVFGNFEEGNTIRFENDGKQFLWNNLNDTIFQITGFNRILPVYVINLGKHRASQEEIRKIGFDLSGKIIPISYAETKSYIFLRFCKDAYDSQDNRKNKKVKIYYALYSKLSKELSILKGDPFNYSPEILENDIDGGVPVWPLSFMAGNNGELLISLKGKELKDRVVSQEYKRSNAPEEKKKDLELFAKTLTDNDDVLMIVK